MQGVQEAYVLYTENKYLATFAVPAICSSVSETCCSGYLVAVLLVQGSGNPLKSSASM